MGAGISALGVDKIVKVVYNKNNEVTVGGRPPLKISYKIVTVHGELGGYFLFGC